MARRSYSANRLEEHFRRSEAVSEGDCTVADMDQIEVTAV